MVCSGGYATWACRCSRSSDLNPARQMRQVLMLQGNGATPLLESAAELIGQHTVAGLWQRGHEGEEVRNDQYMPGGQQRANLSAPRAILDGTFSRSPRRQAITGRPHRVERPDWRRSS